MGVEIRPAEVQDLPAALYAWRSAEGMEPDHAPREGDPVPSSLPHAFDTGTMLVAAEDDRIVGFAATIDREPVTYLGQMFVLPEIQSGGVGRRLLEAVMPGEDRLRSTVASSDPRAVGLYVRHGMRPFWPVFDLEASVEHLRSLPPTDVEAETAEAGDPELIQWDAEIGGRLRPQDHAYWVRRKGGVPLWFERRGKRLGFGYVQVQPRSSDARWYGDTIRVGPLGVHEEADAVDCLIRAIDWARGQGGRLSVLVPGPHPG
ncbi:MAG: GNAT family N-acetyltransferase, partial [Chloroflexia bacterium]|nr:GNAT family N-acetyltransferase [Chloroflexia bacterium]